jgi:hypothetical protein
MLLQDYLKASGKTLQGAAAELELNWVTLWRWTKGKATPTAENIRALVKWSGGAITADDLLGIKKAAPVKTAVSKRAARKVAAS